VGDINNVLVAVDITDDRVSSVDICSLKERSWTLDDRFLGCIMLAADDIVSDKKKQGVEVYRTKRCVSYNGVGLVASPALSSRWPLLL